MTSLKYLNNFWRTLEMPLINCKKDIILTCSVNYLKITGTVANRVPAFAIADTKLYLPVKTLSTQDNVKLLKQLNSGFKRKINQNKYQSKEAIREAYKKNNLRTFDNIQKIATRPEYHYTTGCLLDCNQLKKYYKMIAIDLSNKEALDLDHK